MTDRDMETVKNMIFSPALSTANPGSIIYSMVHVNNTPVFVQGSGPGNIRRSDSGEKDWKN